MVVLFPVSISEATSEVLPVAVVMKTMVRASPSAV
jgi:hypothetical protein